MALLCGRLARTRSPLLGAAFLGALVAGGCRRVEPLGTAARASAAPSPVAGSAPSSCPGPAAAPEAAGRPLRRCFADLPPWIDSPVALLLDRAGEYLERSDADGALACAEEAARQAPRSIEAHHDRSVALIRLGRIDEARDALALALALAPTDPETLELAADFYVNHLTASAERAAIGLEYARRGSRHAAGRDRHRVGRLALLEGQALIDLGRAQEALRPIATAVRLLPEDAAVRYERGVALFELCRFSEAQRSFDRALALEPGHAHALYHLGLIHEREGQEARAEQRFAEASRRDPKAFPPVPAVSPAEFSARLRRVLDALPRDIRSDVAAITVEAAELPSSEDLTAELPPLSPTILGLYRGLPLGRDEAQEPTAASRGTPARQARVPAGASASGNPATFVTPERAIVLYRRNILRSIPALTDLDRAIERTLLHEVGHLRGEDDGSLRDRGLE